MGIPGKPAPEPMSRAEEKRDLGVGPDVPRGTDWGVRPETFGIPSESDRRGSAPSDVPRGTLSPAAFKSGCVSADRDVGADGASCEGVPRGTRVASGDVPRGTSLLPAKEGSQSRAAKRDSPKCRVTIFF